MDCLELPEDFFKDAEEDPRFLKINNDHVVNRPVIKILEKIRDTIEKKND
jgi:hypothetical protein